MHRPSALVAALLLVPAALAAQSHPLVGTWDLSLPAGVRVEDGEPTPIMGKGNVVFSQVGDSIVGTLKVEPPEGMPARPAARLAAKASSGPLTFVQQSTATVRSNGAESTHKVTNTYVFEATGDALKGTVARDVEGVTVQLPGPMPLSGTRVKS